MDIIKYSKDPTFKLSKQKNIYIIWELVLSYFKMTLNVAFIIITYLVQIKAFCMTNITGSKLPIFSHPGKITGYWITTRSFPYRANMGVSG
jgi:hypothetical protein